jgi:surface polysaccharide O-acyltransferase-like enzyme
MQSHAQPVASSSGLKPHDSSLDGVRFTATLMVLLIHISGKGFAGLIPHWWAVNTYESISRICVPLFFMTTGALLLPKPQAIVGVLKRAWRIIFVLVAWSFIYFVYLKFHGPVASNWLAAILREPVVGHFWYLYTLIPIYFLVPVLSAFFVSAPRRLQLGTLVVWFVVASAIPFVNRFAGRTIIGVDVSVFYIYPAYVLAGAYLYSIQKDNSRLMIPCLVLLWALSTFLTAFFTWYFSKDAQVNTELYYEYFAPLVVVSTLCAFVSVRSITAGLVSLCPVLKKGLKMFGELSFGIYLIHPMIIWEFERRGFDWHFINPWLAIPCILLGVVTVSGAIILVIKKIPVIRSIVPG